MNRERFIALFYGSPGQLIIVKVKDFAKYCEIYM